MYINPYENLSGGEWYKTNFHTHAGTGPNTCGANPIDIVLKEYKTLGYNAICISNHDLYTDTISYDTDGKLFMIQGVEYSNDPHMLTIGVKRSLHQLSHQDAINATLEDGGFTILCHPNWIRKEYWKWDDVDKLTGYLGIEVINMLIYRLSGSGLATDLWDHLLTSGKLVFGFGNDDFHTISDAGRSCNYIYSTERSFDGIKRAVSSGCFTASTGLILKYLDLKDDIITVKAAYPKNTYINKFTYKFITDGGKLSSISYGEEAVFKLNDEKYARVEVMGENGATLFTQPVYNPEFLKKA